MSAQLNRLLTTLDHHGLSSFSTSISDRDLLERFVATRDETAFAALTRRHGPMVMRLCRRVLGETHAAEDAFQAVFLVLARRAKGLRPETLTTWLYSVSRRVSLKMTAQRRRRESTPLGNVEPVDPQPDPLRQITVRELLEVVEREVARMPRVYQMPLVLCLLEGQTMEEAARQLGWTVGSVRGRLERGRDRLRKRLASRGLAIAAVMTAVEAAKAGTTVSRVLILSTASAAAAYASGVGPGATGSIALLADSACCWTVTAKMKWVGLLAVVSLILGSGRLFVATTGLLPQQEFDASSSGPAPQTTAVAPQENKSPAREPRLDQHGDPLPVGAFARLGSVRLRHEGLVGSLAVAPGGRTIAAVADKGLVSWDLATGRPVHRLKLDQAACSAALAPDGKSAAIGCRNNMVYLLDLDSGKEMRRFVGHEGNDDRFGGGVMGVAFTPDGATIVTWGTDSTVRLWETRSGKELRKLSDLGDKKGWTVHALSRDGRLLAFSESATDTTVHLWDVAADKEAGLLTHAANVSRVAFSRDGKFLAAAFNQDQQPGKIAIWDVAGGKEKCTLAGHESMVLALAFAPDGKTLASGGFDMTLRLWDLDSGKELHKALRHGSSVYQVAFGGDGKTLMSVGFEHRVRLWDVAAWRERLVADGPALAIRSLAWSPDGKRLASASGKNVWMWEPATGKLLRKLETETWHVSTALFSTDGKDLVAGDNEGTFHVWEAETGKHRRSFDGDRLQTQQMALAPDGTMVAVWGHEPGNTIALRRLAAPKEVRKLEVPPENPGVRAALSSLLFSPDGRTLYASSGTHLAILRWDVASGAVLPSIGNHDGGLNGVALSPDGRSVAAITMGGTLVLWELATGQARLVVKDAGYATTVVFSPDGRLLALANAGNHQQVTGKDAIWSGAENREQVRLIRVADGKVVRRFAGHTGGIGCLSFSPEGKALASGGHDTTVIIWDVKGAGRLDAAGTGALKPEELTALWAGLGGEAAEAHKALTRLAANADRAVRLIDEHLKPVKAADSDRLATLLKKLDSNDFKQREAATEELKKLGDGVEAGMRKALEGDLPVESRRRVEGLVEELFGRDGVSGERIRALRAIEVLERIGEKDARDLLKKLSEGATGAWLTDEACRSLRRLR